MNLKYNIILLLLTIVLILIKQYLLFLQLLFKSKVKITHKIRNFLIFLPMSFIKKIHQYMFKDFMLLLWLVAYLINNLVLI